MCVEMLYTEIRRSRTAWVKYASDYIKNCVYEKKPYYPYKRHIHTGYPFPGTRTDPSLAVSSKSTGGDRTLD